MVELMDILVLDYIYLLNVSNVIDILMTCKVYANK